MTKAIYLDNHATTQLDPEVLDRLNKEVFSGPFNASAVHNSHGDTAKQLFESAQKSVAEYFKVSPKQIIFTSGSTESLNLILRSYGSKSSVRSILTSPLEHPAVLQCLEALREEGLCDFDLIDVDSKGRLKLEQLESKLGNNQLACFMAANNEIGNIYPIHEIAKSCTKLNVPFVSDITQLVTKVNPSVFNKCDLLVLSGHKIHALQGSGVVIVNNPKLLDNLSPLLYGGGQQKGIRPGTINLAGACSIAWALELSDLEVNDKILTMRDLLQAKLLDSHPDIVVSGDLENRLCNNLHFCVPNTLNTFIIEQLRGKVSVSTGSACASGTVQPSKVLQAINCPPELMQGAIRIGLSKFNTMQEIEEAAALIAGAIELAKEFS